jgi:hypothetical protein
MRRILELVLIADAALFFFGAVQHTGVAIGPLREPVIVPAAIVEAICGIALLSGAVAFLVQARKAWAVAMAGNLVALGGVLLGMAALAAGAGPRTASNDLYHRIMLVLIGAGLGMLFLGRPALARNRNRIPGGHRNAA